MAIKFILKQNETPASGQKIPPTVLGEYIFDGSLFTIGSDPGSTIVVPNAAPEQAVIVAEGENMTLINGADGTVLNRRKLRREALEPLAAGNKITIGDYVISVVSTDAPNHEKLNGSAISAGSVLDAFPAPAVDADAATEIAPLTDPIPKPTLPPPEVPEPEPAVVFDTKESLSRSRKKRSEPQVKLPERNFADILNTLRTEEDSFYFIVKNGEREERKIPLEQNEMPLGVDAHGELVGTVDEISALYAIVRKDWSGIVIEAQHGAALNVNDEQIPTTRRLRNGDQVNFVPRQRGVKNLPVLVLHEPSSLVALESILGNRPAGGEKMNFNNGTAFPAAEAALAAAPQVSILDRRFLGYFSLLEIAAMAIGTLIMTVVIFLMLELFIG